MHIDKKTGLLVTALYIPSPNCDDRPENELSLIVLHNISLPPGEFGGPYINQLFTNTLDPEAHEYFSGIHTLKVSSHLLVRRDGQIIQYVPFHKRAWHAGVSRYLGRSVCNDFSIGIELEGDDVSAFTDAQYVQLVAVLKALVACYESLDMQHITGHEHIAPGRKTDPGPCFDWSRLGRECQAILPARADEICRGSES